VRTRAITFAAAVSLALALLTPAVAGAAFGAIAVDQHTTAWGISYRSPSVAVAQHRALLACHADCKVMVRVHNRCAAVVVSQLGFFAAIGFTHKGALRVARLKAHEARARELAWVCSG
jgi:hypothetical protein